MRHTIHILAVFFTAISLNAQISEKSADNLSQGYVYVHTLRNSPSITQNGVKIGAKRHDFLPANGLEVETLDGQCATLILSNRTAIFVKGKAKFAIENFEQILPFESQITDEYEAEHSQLRISVDYGDIYLAMLSPRPTSRTLVKTKFGVIEPKATAMCISCDEKASKFAIINGQATFCGLDNKRDFIQQGQIGIVEAAESKEMYPLKIEPIDILQEEKYEEQLQLCKLAIQSVEFKFDKNAKISARRLVPKDFFLRKKNTN